MAPIPLEGSFAANLTERITRLSNIHQECLEQIERLRKTSGVGTDAARAELANVIHQTLKESELEVQSINLQIANLNPSIDSRATLQSRCNQLGGEFKIARQQYREAQLIAKRQSEIAKRELLFGNRRRNINGTPDRDRKDVSQEQVVESASNDVTIALRRTHALMEAELARSQYAAETLASSTATLKELTQNYSAFDSLLSASRGLITSLVRRNRSDQWYYSMSLYCLVSTIIYLIIRRLFYGPIRFFIWLPLRFLWRILSFTSWLVLGTGSSSKTAVSVSGGQRHNRMTEMTSTGSSVTSIAEQVAESMKPQQSIPSQKPMEQSTDSKHVLHSESGAKVEISLEPVEIPLETTIPDGGESFVEEHHQEDAEGIPFDDHDVDVSHLDEITRENIEIEEEQPDVPHSTGHDEL